MKDFYNIFEISIQEIYAAEKELVKEIPGFIEAVREPKLKEALSNHLEETNKQAIRLEEIASELDIDLSLKKSAVMHALLQEGSKRAKANCSHEVKDAAIIAAAQSIEHYEMSVYRTLKAYASMLKLEVTEQLLDQSLKEEVNADKTLGKIAEGTIFTKGVNKKACSRGCA
jgi:ferritin-like metal-binding protein YciE